MFATGAAMPAPAINPDLVYKIAFLQCLIFTGCPASPLLPRNLKAVQIYLNQYQTLFK
jgi:hypothetical protein